MRQLEVSITVYFNNSVCFEEYITFLGTNLEFRACCLLLQGLDESDVKCEVVSKCTGQMENPGTLEPTCSARPKGNLTMVLL